MEGKVGRTVQVLTHASMLWHSWPYVLTLIIMLLPCVPGCNREGFFKKQLLALAHATQKDGYNALLNACKETQLLIDLSYPSIPAIDINQQQPDLQTISLDKYSKSILPDEWKHVCPITLWRWKLSLQVCSGR